MTAKVIKTELTFSFNSTDYDPAMSTKVGSKTTEEDGKKLVEFTGFELASRIIKEGTKPGSLWNQSARLTAISQPDAPPYTAGRPFAWHFYLKEFAGQCSLALIYNLDFGFGRPAGHFVEYVLPILRKAMHVTEYTYIVYTDHMTNIPYFKLEPLIKWESIRTGNNLGMVFIPTIGDI